MAGGRASGDLALTEPLAFSDQDVDGAGDPAIREGTLTLRLAVDCMKVSAIAGAAGRDDPMTCNDEASPGTGASERFYVQRSIDKQRNLVMSLPPADAAPR